ncbi:MAG: LAGLIDADG family homing endonuclease [Candidatus Bathyarchaeia archaeon]
MPRKIDSSLTKEIVKLRGERRAYKQIAKDLSIAVGTVYKYSKGLIKSVGREHLRKPVRIPSTLERAKLVTMGHCLFDGSVSRGTIRYTNSSMDLIEEFIINMSTSYQIEPNGIGQETGKHLPLFTVSYYSRNVTDDLQRLIPTFSTKSEDCLLPEAFFDLNDSDIQAFLRTFWEDEGCVTLKGEIQGKTSNPALRDQLLQLHGMVGVKCGKFVDRGGNAYGLRLRISGPNLKNFDEKVGFRKAIITRGFNVGTKKRDLLYEVYRHHLTEESL